MVAKNIVALEELALLTRNAAKSIDAFDVNNFTRTGLQAMLNEQVAAVEVMNAMMLYVEAVDRVREKLKLPRIGTH